MSDEKFSAKFEVKPSAIPDRLKNNYENVKHPSAIKLIPVAKSNENPRESQKTNGLTMLELEKFMDDPFWVKIRRVLMCLSVLVFLAIFTIGMLIVAYTPACELAILAQGNARRTRECKSDEECAAIQNTTCMSDPRDYKMRCLCRDSSAPINGACPNRPRAVGSPCKMDSECIEGSECKSMNITVTSFKSCQCKEGFTSRDGYCSSAFYIPVPSLVTVLAAAWAVLYMNKPNIRF